MTATATSSPLRYHGSRNPYVDIAVRGDGQYLGLNIEYAVHPANVGCFLLRFIVHGEGVSSKTKFTHFTFRETAKFVVPETATTSASLFHGIRLNKLAIPVFTPAIKRTELEKFTTKFAVWPLLTEWIAEQAAAEGFAVTVDLEAEIRRMVIPEPTPEESVSLTIEFPNLAAPEAKKQALSLVQKPESEEDDDEEDDDDGEAEDKDWLN